jgi:hypothetical protein
LIHRYREAHRDLVDDFSRDLQQKVGIHGRSSLLLETVWSMRHNMHT